MKYQRRRWQPIQENATYYSRSELKTSFGDWLSSLADWDWWATLTFKRLPTQNYSYDWTKVGTHFADNCFNRWIRALPNNYQDNPDWRPKDVKWVRCTEYRRSDGVPHYHCLLTGTGDLSRSGAWSNWFDCYGMARIEPYDNNRGANYYLCKYVIKELGEIDIKLD